MKDTPKPLPTEEENILKKGAPLVDQIQTDLERLNEILPTKFTEVEDSHTIPVVAEQLEVEKKMVKTGTVVVTKKVVEKEVTVDTSYTSHEVEMKRITIGRDIEEGEALPTTRTEGDLTIIPVLKEVEEVIVRKRMVLVEEIHLHRKTTEHPREEKMILRGQKVKIERQKEDDPLSL